MRIEMKGFNELQKRLQDMQKAAQELDGQQNVPLTELLSEEFISEHTSLSNLEEFFENGEFKFKTREEFDAIPQAQLDEYVRSVSNFEDWEEMLGSATKEYISKKLGF